MCEGEWKEKNRVCTYPLRVAVVLLPEAQEFQAEPTQRFPSSTRSRGAKISVGICCRRRCGALTATTRGLREQVEAGKRCEGLEWWKKFQFEVDGLVVEILGHATAITR